MAHGRKPAALTASSGSGRRPGRRQWLVWMAMIAILIQTIVPDLAMAAWTSAAWQGRDRDGEAIAAYALVAPDHSDIMAGCGPASPEDPAKPAGAHDHGGSCAFCLALSAHALAPGDTVGAMAFAHPRPIGASDPAGIVPRALFLARHCPRAPPKV